MSDYQNFLKQLLSGELPSPQVYEESFYIKLRITGTGITERIKFNEEQEPLLDASGNPLKYKIDRQKTSFLSDDFIRSCIGIPVVITHPESDFVNGENYKDFVVGTIVEACADKELAEVWGIARIFDPEVLKLIDKGLKSTSPCIKSNEIIDKNSDVVKEDFIYIDHLALVVEGYWDTYSKKAIQIDSKEVVMAEEIKETQENIEKSESDKIEMLSEKLDKLIDILGVEKAEETLADDKELEAEEKKQGEALDNILSKLDVLIGAIGEKEVKEEAKADEVVEKEKDIRIEENDEIHNPAIEVQEDEEETLEELEEKKTLVDNAYLISTKYKEDGAGFTKERREDTKESFISRWLKANKNFVDSKFHTLLNEKIDKGRYALAVDAMVSVENKLKSLAADRAAKNNKGIQLVSDDGTSKIYKNVF